MLRRRVSLWTAGTGPGSEPERGSRPCSKPGSEPEGMRGRATNTGSCPGLVPGIQSEVPHAPPVRVALDCRDWARQ